jgi:hypothetical protein
MESQVQRENVECTIFIIRREKGASYERRTKEDADTGDGRVLA